MHQNYHSKPSRTSRTSRTRERDRDRQRERQRERNHHNPGTRTADYKYLFDLLWKTGLGQSLLLEYYNTDPQVGSEHNVNDAQDESLVFSFVLRSTCVDLRRCLRDQDQSLLSNVNRWRRLINTTACSPRGIYSIILQRVLFWTGEKVKMWHWFIAFFCISIGEAYSINLKCSTSSIYIFLVTW